MGITSLVDKESAEVLTIKKSDQDLGFEMDFTYEPTNENPICKLGDHRVLSLGNMMTIVASPAQGKSHLTEAYISNCIDPDADAFGFIFTPPEDRKTVIHIDTERTKNDCYYAYLRIAKRIKPEYKNNERIQNLIFKSFIDIDSIEARLRTFDHLVSSHPVGLVIIDGLTDLILNTNDEEQSKKLIIHLVAKANEY
ncbi:MAG: hypothetical protein IH947_11290, partial [Bacteroidetes bacterium]|nr:hypothetical protein [Bacteroidota bacterium]